MSRDRLIVIGVVLFAVLAFLVYRQMKKDESIGQPATATKDFPTVSAPDDVDKISITNGDKGEVVLEKKPDPASAGDGGAGGTWVMTKPVSAPASQQAVKDLISNLKELKVDSIVNLVLDDAVRKDKQLDAIKGVHVVAFKGADKKVDETFGKSGSAGTTLVMVADRPNDVWAAKGFSSYLYTKEPSNWRDKEVFKFDDAAVSQITITNKNGDLSFTKGDKWAGTSKKKAIERLDDDKIKDLLRSYKNLNADDFGDGKAASDTGLDAPEGMISITLKDGAGKYDLAVGKTSSGSSRYAQKAGDPTVFVIGPGAADWAVAEQSKFQRAADAGAPKDGGGMDTPPPMMMPPGMPMPQMPPGHP